VRENACAPLPPCDCPLAAAGLVLKSWSLQLEDAVARARQVEGQLLNARKDDDELLHENRCLSSKLATVTFQVPEPLPLQGTMSFATLLFFNLSVTLLNTRRRV
jgi:hypothetical protein